MSQQLVANTDLTTTGVSAGTYGNSAYHPVVTVGTDGRITSVTNTAILVGFSGGGTNATSYTTGALLTSNGTSIISLANTGTAGTYGNATYVPVITTDAYGRVTSVVNTAISGAGGGSVPTLTDDTTTNASYYPTMYSVTAGTPSYTYVSSTKLYFNPSTGILNSTTFNSLSDINKKENIKTLENSLEKVLLMRGVSYRWKENNLPSIGLIAQEVEKIIPELVSSDEQGQKTLNYGNMIGVLIESIKEQQKIIVELEKRIGHLEND